MLTPSEKMYFNIMKSLGKLPETKKVLPKIDSKLLKLKRHKN
jgi:hypothetical protein